MHQSAAVEVAGGALQVAAELPALFCTKPPYGGGGFAVVARIKPAGSPAIVKAIGLVFAPVIPALLLTLGP